MARMARVPKRMRASRVSSLHFILTGYPMSSLSVRSFRVRREAIFCSASPSVRLLLGLGLFHRLRQGREEFFVLVAVRLEPRVHVVRVGPIPLLPGVGVGLARRTSLLVLAVD